MDVKQFFDGLWPEECINDLFQYGIEKDLPLLYNACNDIEIKVRTPVGKTQEATISKKIMQGDIGVHLPVL